MELLHLSDLHFGSEDAAALGVVAEFVRARAPSAVIVTGDLTAIGAARELEQAFAWLRGLEAPVLALPGNHDTGYYEPLVRLFDPFGRFERAAAGVRTGAWSTRDFLIAPINTARGVQLRVNWALGAISKAQARSAAAAIESAAPGALRIVASHHPLIWPHEAPIGGRTRGGPDAAASLIGAGAQVFLSGHLHHGAAWPIDVGAGGAVAISAGTLSTRLRSEPGGFMLIRRPGADAIEVETVHIVGDGPQTVGIARFAIATGGGASLARPAAARA
ncbi:MAG: metallophosphoesterase [Hyphomonadaceae bacterium]|nr:metallophosphoesterase [Hyphomonadaceae bacterium]